VSHKVKGKVKRSFPLNMLKSKVLFAEIASVGNFLQNDTKFIKIDPVVLEIWGFEF